MVRRRTSGEPIQQIVGWAEFCGLRIKVEPGVFLPRQRTEFLVERAIALGSRGDTLLDICCGSGAIGVAVAAGLGRADLHATDIDPAAVRCAAKNVERGWRADVSGRPVRTSPPLAEERFDLILANAPYVPTGSST